MSTDIFFGICIIGSFILGYFIGKENGQADAINKGNKS